MPLIPGTPFHGEGGHLLLPGSKGPGRLRGRRWRGGGPLVQIEPRGLACRGSRWLRPRLCRRGNRAWPLLRSAGPGGGGRPGLGFRAWRLRLQGLHGREACHSRPKLGGWGDGRLRERLRTRPLGRRQCVLAIDLQQSRISQISFFAHSPIDREQSRPCPSSEHSIPTQRTIES